MINGQFKAKKEIINAYIINDITEILKTNLTKVNEKTDKYTVIAVDFNVSS